jgi:putative peptidoglycan lipid II flippase
VFASIFRVGAGTDAFFVAFRIPNFLRRLFAEGAFSQAFVPVLAEYKSKNDETEVKMLVSNVAGTLGAILFVVSLLGVLAAPVLILVFAPGFVDEPSKYSLGVQMLRITFPYLLFISLTAFAGAILNSYGKFAVPAFTPVLLNVSLIACALWLSPHMAQPVVALAWGVFIAGIAQLLYQLPHLKKLGLLMRPRWGWHHAGVRKIIRLMLPAIFGSSVVQINLLFDTLIASFLATGSVTWLYYSDRLVEFPLGVFGIALATVILPKLSKQHAEAAPEKFSATLDWALRMVILIGLPAMVGLFLLAGPMLAALFQHGAFSANDVQMASLSLMAYATGLPGFILIKVMAPGFYARQDTRTPVRIGIIAMLANMAMNVLFVVALVSYDFQGPHMGLALATALSAYLNAGLLYRQLRLLGIYTPQRNWGIWWLRVLVGLLVMAGVIWLLRAGLSDWLAWGIAKRILQLLLCILAGAMSYFATLWLLGVRPANLQLQR